MYLELGKVKKNYAAENIDDFMIFSEIPNSQLSYEKPILVRTIDELNIWFGKDFDSRDYFEELINLGVTLYLYKPISEVSYLGDEYIDLDSYTLDPGIYSNPDMLPEVGVSGIKYKVLENNCFYIWFYNNWYSEDELPQNIDNNSNSVNNRDTLLLSEKENLYSHPEFRIDKNNLGVYSKDYDLKWEDNRIFLMPEDNQTLGILFKETDTLSDGIIILESQKTVVVDRKSIEMGDRCLFYCGEIPDTKVDEDGRNIYPNLASYYEFEFKINNLEDLFIYLEKIGYKRNNNLIYASYPFAFPGLCTLNGIKVEDSFDDTYNIITKYIDNNLSRVAEFWSRTIGKDSNPYEEEESTIKLNIEVVDEDEKIYRVYVERYTYSEVYEGTAFEIGSQINTKSKLIHCLIEDNSLVSGNFYLKRSKLEDQFEESYWKSLNVMFDLDQDSVFPDYFLIPNNKIYNYRYDKLLEYSKKYNFQVLIENKNSTYEIKEVPEFPEVYEDHYIYKKKNSDNSYSYMHNGEEVLDQDLIALTEAGNDFIYNLTNDKENRLVYFYRPMLVSRKLRPGYYAYLLGLLKNIFSIEEKYMLYYPPKEKNLKNYKSNYLTYNNHMYYYEEYFSGDKPISSGWLRFIVGKVSREFYKHKWELLGKKSESVINTIIRRLENSFRLIRYIKVDNIEKNERDNILKITVSVYMSDLVNSNMTVDITLNF